MAVEIAEVPVMLVLHGAHGALRVSVGSVRCTVWGSVVQPLRYSCPVTERRNVVFELAAIQCAIVHSPTTVWVVSREARAPPVRRTLRTDVRASLLAL